MAALIVGMAVMAVMMTVAMPVWKQTVQREKEEELVFRGEQIARSIGLFQRKFANAYPPTLDVLVEQKFLRKKYKDPITNDDFVPLTQGQTQAGTPGGTGRGTPPATPAAPVPAGGGSPLGTSAGPFGAAPGGIVGVTSKSKDVSIRLYKGRSHYNEWAFVYTAPPQTGPGGPGGPAGRGGPGGPNGPAGPNGPFGPNGPGRANGPFGPNAPGGPNGPGGPGFPGGRPAGPGTGAPSPVPTRP